MKPKEDPHSLALEEVRNPSTRNWDDFMCPRPKKYSIVYAIQDFYFCEVGERKKFKKYLLMHFTRNVKETDSKLVNFCFTLEEKAKSRLMNCRIRKRQDIVSKWINMLKLGMLSFADYRARDWFLQELKVKDQNQK